MQIENYVYCPKCGNELIRKNYIHEFSMKTGKPINYIKLKCPKNNIFETHVELIFDNQNNLISKYSSDDIDEVCIDGL